MASHEAHSPLYAQTLEAVAEVPVNAQLLLAERELRAHINLRGDAGDKKFMNAVKKVIGTGLPTDANTTAVAGAFEVLWLSPDEWLLIGPQADGAKLIADLNKALKSHHYAVTDLSSAQTIIAMRGTAAREALSKGCPFDLHPSVFASGQCAQTNVAKAMGLIIARDDGIDVVVRRSFSEYLWRWLRIACDEYQPVVGQIK